MLTAIPLPPDVDPGITFPERRRFTRTDYWRMINEGLIELESPVELLNGELVPMSPIGDDHQDITDMLNAFFTPLLAGKLVCRIQGSQATNDFSEPEPDLQLLRRKARRNRSGLPTPREVPLVIEVADSSLAKDCGAKMRLYAAAGIVEYWVADLIHDEMIVYRNPNPATKDYSDVQRYGKGMKVAPLCAPECELDLTWLFS